MTFDWFYTVLKECRYHGFDLTTSSAVEDAEGCNQGTPSGVHLAVQFGCQCLRCQCVPRSWSGMNSLQQQVSSHLVTASTVSTCLCVVCDD